ncbi:MAG: PDZ domain-containing protein, partial [Candidatus Baltobacteraceae bacterium]
DYAGSKLTLTPLATFQYAGSGTRAPIVFQEDEPLTNAAADDAQGLFGIDTGNAGAPILFETFLRQNGFLQRYERGSAATGSGTGGSVRLVRHTIGSFSLGGKTFREPVTYFVLGQEGGAFSSTTEAGNVGYNILANFVPTFDYRDGVIYLEPSTTQPPPALNRSGLALSKPHHDAFLVASVRPGSPGAEAGINAGDVITAIDGAPATSLGDADVYAIMRRPPGTVVTLQLGGKAPRTVRITLREMPPL